MKIRFCLVLLTFFLLQTLPAGAQSKLNVVATTEDLAAIAREALEHAPAVLFT